MYQGLLFFSFLFHSFSGFFSTCKDIETFDLEDFKYNFVNITAFRLVDADDVGVRGILRDMERYQPAGNTILNKSKVIQVSSVFYLLSHVCDARRIGWSLDFSRSIFKMRHIYLCV